MEKIKPLSGIERPGKRSSLPIKSIEVKKVKPNQILGRMPLNDISPKSNTTSTLEINRESFDKFQKTQADRKSQASEQVLKELDSCNEKIKTIREEIEELSDTTRTYAASVQTLRNEVLPTLEETLRTKSLEMEKEVKEYEEWCSIQFNEYQLSLLEEFDNLKKELTLQVDETKEYEDNEKINAINKLKNENLLVLLEIEERKDYYENLFKEKENIYEEKLESVRNESKVPQLENELKKITKEADELFATKEALRKETESYEEAIRTMKSEMKLYAKTEVEANEQKQQLEAQLEELQKQREQTKQIKEAKKEEIAKEKLIIETQKTQLRRQQIKYNRVEHEIHEYKKFCRIYSLLPHDQSILFENSVGEWSIGEIEYENDKFPLLRTFTSLDDFVDQSFFFLNKMVTRKIDMEFLFTGNNSLTTEMFDKFLSEHIEHLQSKLESEQFKSSGMSLEYSVDGATFSPVVQKEINLQTGFCLKILCSSFTSLITYKQADYHKASSGSLATNTIALFSLKNDPDLAQWLQLMSKLFNS
ncbi:hypothetical protein LJB42_001669 [Komagataella kurtzmanii]|nr:hypothetical protein LJB42_001669 [Komagataella kurtzmanii]